MSQFDIYKETFRRITSEADITEFLRDPMENDFLASKRCSICEENDLRCTFVCLLYYKGLRVCCNREQCFGQAYTCRNGEIEQAWLHPITAANPCDGCHLTGETCELRFSNGSRWRDQCIPCARQRLDCRWTVNPKPASLVSYFCAYAATHPIYRLIKPRPLFYIAPLGSGNEMPQVLAAQSYSDTGGAEKRHQLDPASSTVFTKEEDSSMDPRFSFAPITQFSGITRAGNWGQQSDGLSEEEWLCVFDYVYQIEGNFYLDAMLTVQ
ncbi:hypothetical protein HD553DRAFT_362478 [Filobasidium floriforme]|uniref:uncharacterized protein n=1 Tax=Filobasidium floriforme TaxID=5210 RepID=UPI001E8E69BA|nr:uncharacterized protein HD553DRAFT_362478 [Filobasidium floriforme]KAH8079881.1 hypothetical protein HD553DRAFT_362478 [Filobasidium floriforme]